MKVQVHLMIMIIVTTTFTSSCKFMSKDNNSNSSVKESENEVKLPMLTPSQLEAMFAEAFQRGDTEAAQVIFAAMGGTGQPSEGEFKKVYDKNAKQYLQENARDYANQQTKELKPYDGSDAAVGSRTDSDFWQGRYNEYMQKNSERDLAAYANEKYQMKGPLSDGAIYARYLSLINNSKGKASSTNTSRQISNTTKSPWAEETSACSAQGSKTGQEFDDGSPACKCQISEGCSSPYLAVTKPPQGVPFKCGSQTCSCTCTYDNGLAAP